MNIDTFNINLYLKYVLFYFIFYLYNDIDNYYNINKIFY